MTTDRFITDTIKLGESETLEFKETARKEPLARIVCSLLNSNGGQVLIGVSDDGNIVGIKNAATLSVDLQNFLTQEIIPEPSVSVSVETYQKKEILLVNVWEGSRQPYVFDGSIFYRRDSQTVRASSKEISALIHNREQSQTRWERQPVLNAELDDLDLSEISATIEASIKNAGINEKTKDPIDFLSYYGLFSNGNFTNAAIILFAKNPAQFLPQCRVRLSYLQEGKTGSSFKDDRLLEGNLFKNKDAIEYFCQKHLELRRTFSDTNWLRNDDLQYPLTALREGVLNALIHQDYSNISGSTSIIIYPDKLEITNFGHLVLKPSELKKSHLSLPFNPDIAQIVFLRGYIEKIGSGTLKIIDACKKAGLKSPSWSDDSNSVKLTFFGDNKTDDVIDGVLEGVTGDVKDKLKQILITLIKTEGLRTVQLSKQTAIPLSSLERYIKQLKDAELIEFKGAPKTGGYYLSRSAQAKLFEGK